MRVLPYHFPSQMRATREAQIGIALSLGLWITMHELTVESMTAEALRDKNCTRTKAAPARILTERHGQVLFEHPPGSHRQPVKALWQFEHEQEQNFSHMWPDVIHEHVSGLQRSVH